MEVSEAGSRKRAAGNQVEILEALGIVQGQPALSSQRVRTRRNKFDNPVLKMRVGRVIERATVELHRNSVGSQRCRIYEAVRNDDQGLHEQQVSSLRTLRLYRGDALRSLPVRSEGGTKEYRRRWIGADNQL